MIRKSEECKVEYREQMRGGNGTVEITNLIASNAELNDKGRLFGKITLKPGCSIGYHVHENDSELFYITKGTGKYMDGEIEKTVTVGDVTICPAGTGHAMANDTSEVLEFVAVIIYA